jgi:hypothetical protein
LLKPHDYYLGLRVDHREKGANYRSPFKPLDSNTINVIRKTANGNYVLSNDCFKDEIEDMLKRRVAPGKPGKPAKKNEIK